jgi:hypothetical protein
VSQLATDLLEPVDMLRHIRAVNVTDLFDKLAEGALSLFRKSFISVKEKTGSGPTVTVHGLGDIGSRGALSAECV